MDQLVECVPNFSEGRDPEKVQKLVSAIKAVKGVYLLDEEMDADHHRAVLTFVGTPQATAQAAFEVTRLAASLIDLRQHQGGHPRVGATDVVPFVPIRGVTMEDCVTLARQVGQRIGAELNIPVFLYERAATDPARASLEVIRRGGLEGLAHRMETDPGWLPDFGPQKLHPTAGATIVGARPPLIAYNVNLQTDDLEIAKAIAKRVRASSGGLPHVKAIGVPLTTRRQVQVSMNLTNFEETPIHVAYEAVQREAEQRGVSVASSEVIGLIPQRALVQAAEFFLKFERFDHSQVLENRLELVLAREARDLGASVTTFVQAVSAGTPTPGGGSVAALAGALAAALGLMVGRITAQAAQRKSPAGGAGSTEAPAPFDFRAAEERLTALTTTLQALIQQDADAYAGVLQAYRLPKSEPTRSQSIAASLRTAIEVPLQTAALASEVASLLQALLPHVKPAMASDLKVGLLMAVAALAGGLENVRENIKSLENQQVIEDLLPRVQQLEQRLVELKAL